MKIAYICVTVFTLGHKRNEFSQLRMYSIKDIYSDLSCNNAPTCQKILVSCTWSSGVGHEIGMHLGSRSLFRVSHVVRPKSRIFLIVKTMKCVIPKS